MRVQIPTACMLRYTLDQLGTQRKNDMLLTAPTKQSGERKAHFGGLPHRCHLHLKCRSYSAVGYPALGRLKSNALDVSELLNGIYTENRVKTVHAAVGKNGIQQGDKELSDEDNRIKPGKIQDFHF